MYKKTNSGKRLLNYLQSNTSILIIALISAVLLWFIISINVFPDIPKTIHNVELEEIVLDDTIAGAKNLSVVSAELPESVDIRIQGARTQIGSLDADKLLASVSLDEVRVAGEYNLPIILHSIDGIDFETISIEPATVKVKLDEIVTVTLPIDEVSDFDMHIAENLYYEKEEITISPDTVQVTGPKSEIERISKVVVAPVVEGELTESTSIRTSVIQLYNSGGSLIDLQSSNIQILSDEFYVNVNLSVKKTLKIKPQIVNTNSTSEYFDISTLEGKYSLDVEEITLLSSDSSISELTEIETEEIRLLDIEPGDVFDVALKIPEGYENVTGITSVKVTFDLEGYKVKEISRISCSNIVIKNLPSNYNLTFITNSISVILVGPEDVLFGVDGITALDVVLSVDFSKESGIIGSHSVPVTVSIKGQTSAWAIGESSRYLASVEVTETDGV